MEGVLFKQHFVEGADGLFDWLKLNVQWDERMAARKTASFGVAYNYSQLTYPYQDFVPVLAALVPALREVIGFTPNNCLINYYTDGTSKMGYHSDETDILVAGTGIAIVSLGTERTLCFRNIADKQVVNDYVLPSGSLVYMTQEVQQLWQHAIPPADTTEGRMSLTFRRMKVYPDKHAYYYRLGHKSDKLIIEFLHGEVESLFQDLLEALIPITPQVKDERALVDNILVDVDTDYGSFLYLIGAWDIVSITANENQACVAKIAQLLADSDKFMREPWFDSK